MSCLFVLSNLAFFQTYLVYSNKQYTILQNLYLQKVKIFLKAQPLISEFSPGYTRLLIIFSGYKPTNFLVKYLFLSNDLAPKKQGC